MTITNLIPPLALLVVLVCILRPSRVHTDSHRPGEGRHRGQRNCPSGKVPFESQADADRVVLSSQVDRGAGYDRPLQRSYHCPQCKHWHTTSQRKRINR